MMNKKSLFLVFFAFALWGVLPLYWDIFHGVNAIFILACRIFFATITTLIVLASKKRLPEVLTTLRDKSKMKFLVPSAIVITINWGLYIWAIIAGHVLDASLGYYMNPLVVFVAGVLVFRESCGKFEISALILAAAGVLLVTLQCGQFPLIALSHAFLFAGYGILKRFAAVDGLVSVTIETLLFAPFTILYFLFWPDTLSVFASFNFLQWAAIILSGAATAMPLILYSQGVNDLPFITVGFLQYISPTLMLVIGVLLMGQPFTTSDIISFGFIWAGLILFTYGMVLKERSAAKLQAQGENS